MATRVNKVKYCYVTVPSRAGQGAKILGAIKDAGINLLAFSGFPTGRGLAQIDLIPERMAPIARLAKKQGWRLSRPKRAFLIQGDDVVGAVHRHVQKLAKAGINITAVDAAAAGKGRYGAIVWVKQRDYNRAAKALGAK